MKLPDNPLYVIGAQSATTVWPRVEVELLQDPPHARTPDAEGLSKVPGVPVPGRKHRLPYAAATRDSNE